VVLRSVEIEIGVAGSLHIELNGGISLALMEQIGGINPKLNSLMEILSGLVGRVRGAKSLLQSGLTNDASLSRWTRGEDGTADRLLRSL